MKPWIQLAVLLWALIAVLAFLYWHSPYRANQIALAKYAEAWEPAEPPSEIGGAGHSQGYVLTNGGNVADLRVLYHAVVGLLKRRIGHAGKKCRTTCLQYVPERFGVHTCSYGKP